MSLENQKPLPDLPSNLSISSKSSYSYQRAKNSMCKKSILIPYDKFSRWLEEKHPGAAKYKIPILITIGLFASAILIIIIVAAVGGSNGGSDRGSPGLNLSGKGDGTYYDPGVGVGSCGWLNSDSEFVAALNAPQYGVFSDPANSPVCGKCILVTGPKGSVKVKIVDKCPVCKSGDVDMSSTAFDQIADQSEGRVSITWEGC